MSRALIGSEGNPATLVLEPELVAVVSRFSVHQGENTTLRRSRALPPTPVGTTRWFRLTLFGRSPRLLYYWSYLPVLGSHRPTSVVVSYRRPVGFVATNSRMSANCRLNSASCSSTAAGPVPPCLEREFSEPSVVRTDRTSGVRCSEMRAYSSSVRSQCSTPR